jgi:hypothetical protein
MIDPHVVKVLIGCAGAMLVLLLWNDAVMHRKPPSNPWLE